MSAVGKYRPPTREEFASGIAELGKLIGAVEATAPDWTRRLVLAEPEGQWCLLIDDVADDRGYAPWTDATLTKAFPLAYPLAEGVGVLNGPNNPEAELAKRRQQCKDHAAEVERESAARAEDARKKREEELQLEEDKRQFRASDWERLSDARKLGFLLALKVESRDPDLAADLRAVAENGLFFPRARWWT